MPIFQTTLFVCGDCGFADSKTQEVNLFSNPLVAKQNWDHQEVLLCPECNDESLYKEKHFKCPVHGEYGGTRICGQCVEQ